MEGLTREEEVLPSVSVTGLVHGGVDEELMGQD